MCSSLTIEKHSDVLFSVTFNSVLIVTTVTISSADVAEWVSETLRINDRRLTSLVVGLDVESRPNFQRNQHNPVAVLQLCVGQRCLIFQILRAGSVPASLSSFLSDPRFTFVGVGIKEDNEKLLRDWEVGVGKTVELREITAEWTGRKELKQKGLVGLAKEVLTDVVVPQPTWVTLSTWDQDVLSLEQIMYSCVDAYLSFELGRVFRAWEY